MMSEKKIHQKLVKLGAEKLADVLLELASRNAAAADFVDHIVAAPEENIQRFRNKLRNLRKRQRFIDWKESHHFAQNTIFKSGTNNRYSRWAGPRHKFLKACGG